MIFTEGGMGAIESLMREVPGHNHYDDGIAGKYPECRKCRYHTPFSKKRDCVFDKCPYQPTDVFSGKRRGGDKHGSFPG